MDWKINIPGIVNYKPFYIQTDGDSSAVDTLAAFGLVAKSNPLPLLPNPKAPYNNDWKDVDGDDEYTERMYYEAFEFTVSFFIKTYTLPQGSAEVLLRKQVRAFFEKVRKGQFMTYDAYTGVGFRNVRYAGYDEDSFLARNDWARAVIKVKFKVNDPTTVVELVDNVITAV